MKFSFLVAVASLAASANALAPPSSTTGDRRAFLSKVVAVSVASVAIASTPAAFAKDQYSLDFDESIVVKKEEAPKSGGNGGLIVGGALAGGLALSLPFFAPNLARMAGIKNGKLPPK
jgi:hypothetical protein